jgi:hypothetical protein
VIAVRSATGNRIRLAALAPGSASITVWGAGVRDVIRLEVADIATIRLSMLRPLDVHARGAAVYLLVETRDRNGGPLVGDDPSRLLSVQGARANGRGRLSSVELDLDQTGTATVAAPRATTHVLTVVDAAEITAAEVVVVKDNLQTSPPTTLAPKKQTVLAVEGRLADGRAVGVAGLGAVTVLTPDLCLVSPLPKAFPRDIFLAEGKARGLCRLQVVAGPIIREVVIPVVP